MSVRKVIVVNNISLDGVMQAPGRPDEDTRDGFKYGGWAAEYNDEVKGKTMAQGMSQGGDLLFGRRTYEDFFKVWPGRKDNPFTAVLDNTQKYVASTTLGEPLPWKNSTLLHGDAADAVAKLKSGDGGNLTVLGSGVLVQSLMRRNLVDQITLLIHPLTFGTGRRLFAEDGVLTKFRLDQHVVTTKGVIIATYSAA
jgi:dihydrofolate reductase